MVSRAIEQRRLLPYIPPVDEQVATMPAELVLVRGAERPDPLPEELLRASVIDSHAQAEALIRAGDIGS